MKLIINDSLQSFEIYLKGPKGPFIKWLQPKESVVVQDFALTNQAKNLQRRRQIRIKNI